MKRLIVRAFGIALLLGCSSDQVRDFMPGMYVSSVAGEFSVASDTLVIELIEGNNYLIHRRTKYNLVSEGKLGKREYLAEVWRAVYNGETQQLTETREGKVLSFFRDSNYLLVGRREYQKIK
jgi:hypothetical protein